MATKWNDLKRKSRPAALKPTVQKTWSPDFDLSTIPDHFLHGESARRRRAKQTQPPRSQIKRPCEFCQELFGARNMRKHRPVCPKRHDRTSVTRPGWTLKRVTDPEQQQREMYRYWRSRPVGERLAAVWEVTEAAYSIQKVG